MTSAELKAAYKDALDLVAAKQAAVDTAQAAYTTACADLNAAQAAANDLLAQIQAAIAAGTL